MTPDELTAAQEMLRAVNTFRSGLQLPNLTSAQRALVTEALSARDPAAWISAPAPAPAPPPPAPAFRVGFAKQMLESPASWGDLEEQAARLELLFLEHWETAFLERAKAANPKLRVFAYQNATYARPGSASQSSTGLDLATAQKLGYATGLQNGFSLDLCDITKPGYADAWTTAVLARLQGLGFDGIYLDDFNIEAVSPSLPSGVSATQWADALRSFVQTVRARTSGEYLLMANMNGTWGQHLAVTQLLSYLDGGYDEFSLTWPGLKPVSQGFIDNALAAMDIARANGKAYISSTLCGSTTDTKLALAGYCLALIGGASHYAPRGPSSTPPAIWLPEFDRDLGAPLGPYVKSGSVYTRRFEHAIATVDVAKLTGTVA